MKKTITQETIDNVSKCIAGITIIGLVLLFSCIGYSLYTQHESQARMERANQQVELIHNELNYSFSLIDEACATINKYETEPDAGVEALVEWLRCDYDGKRLGILNSLRDENAEMSAKYGPDYYQWKVDMIDKAILMSQNKQK